MFPNLPKYDNATTACLLGGLGVSSVFGICSTIHTLSAAPIVAGGAFVTGMGLTVTGAIRAADIDSEYAFGSNDPIDA